MEEAVKAALRGSQGRLRAISSRARGAVRPVSRFPPRNRSPGRRRYPALRRLPANPQGDHRRRLDLTPLPPHLPPCPRRLVGPMCWRLPDQPWGRPSTADNLGHHRNPPLGAAPAGGEHVCHWTAAHHDNVGQRRCRKARGFQHPGGTAQDNKFLQRFSWVVQGRRAARRPSSRRPSRFPRPRVPRTERTSIQVAQGAAGNPPTNARPTEMPMKQRDPE